MKLVKTVSSAIRKKLNKVYDYAIGEILICRQYKKLNKGQVTFQVKFKYKIIKIEGVVYIIKYNNR